MPWIQIKINSTANQADAISDLLMENGATAITLQDRYDHPVFEPLPDEVRLWGDTDVIALLDAEVDLSALRAALQCSPLLGPDFNWQIDQVEEREWQRAWMEHFHPLQFGQRLWICPSWRPVPDPEAVNVMLDPGLAFGTGSHPTTALCLQWLDSLDLHGKRIIDFGCGSGILAIAALKLGAAQAIGIDIDPQALQASQENAGRNGVAGQLTLYQPHQQPAGLTADVVVANILAGPLCELAPMISAMVAPKGILGLSGILAHQAEQVIAAYQAEFTLKPLTFQPIAEKEEWCCITAIHHT